MDGARPIYFFLFFSFYDNSVFIYNENRELLSLYRGQRESYTYSGGTLQELNKYTRRLIVAKHNIRSLSLSP